MHFFRINFFLLSGFHCVYGPQLLHPFICRCTSRLLPWSSCCNSAAVNTGAHVSLSVLISSGYMPRSGIAGSCGGFIPSVLRSIHTILHSSCINLHSLPAMQEGSFSPHPLQHLLFVDFLMIPFLTVVRWYLMVVLICISLIISTVEHFFMCFFKPSVCLLWRSVFLGLFPTFAWIVFLVLSCMSCLYILEINSLSVVSLAVIHLLLFSPILRVVFSPCL